MGDEGRGNARDGIIRHTFYEGQKGNQEETLTGEEGVTRKQEEREMGSTIRIQKFRECAQISLDCKVYCWVRHRLESMSPGQNSQAFQKALATGSIK